MMNLIRTWIPSVKYAKGSRGADMSIMLGFCFTFTSRKLGSPWLLDIYLVFVAKCCALTYLRFTSTRIRSQQRYS